MQVIEDMVITNMTNGAGEKEAGVLVIVDEDRDLLRDGEGPGRDLAKGGDVTRMISLTRLNCWKLPGRMLPN